MSGPRAAEQRGPRRKRRRLSLRLAALLLAALGLAALGLQLGPGPDWGTVLQLVVQRLQRALLAPFGLATLAWSLGLLALFSALALPAGWGSGFLLPGWKPLPWRQQLHQAAALLVMPALGEELLFRVALLPSPPVAQGGSALGWGALSLGLFVLYHPLAGHLWYRRGRTLFHDRHFLLLCTLLGTTCTVAFLVSGSLWSPVLIHWVAVAVWLGPLQGSRHLANPEADRNGPQGLR